MKADSEQTKQMQQDFLRESALYYKQISIWLATVSAGGTIALATFVASLPNPAYAFELMIFSFWGFLLGIVSAGLATYARARIASEKAVYLGHVYNIGQINDVIVQIPEMISSPQAIADNANSERNQLIKESENFDLLAENASRNRFSWERIWALLLIFSLFSFVFGFSWPLIQVGYLDKKIVPTTVSPIESFNTKED
ncbi:MAG: hypothetical protein ABJK39_00595 [Hyphomicrobiales bacterium]